LYRFFSLQKLFQCHVEGGDQRLITHSINFFDVVEVATH
jgi:hypothetical protein